MNSIAAVDFPINTLSSLAYLKSCYLKIFVSAFISKKVQVGKDQEKAQSEKDSHTKNRGGKKRN